MADVGTGGTVQGWSMGGGGQRKDGRKGLQDAPE
jgi:hypothetical protein